MGKRVAQPILVVVILLTVVEEALSQPAVYAGSSLSNYSVAIPSIRVGDETTSNPVTHGWVVFDLSTIPPGADITSATLNFNVEDYSSSAGPPQSQIVGLDINPQLYGAGVTGADIWNSITGSTIYYDDEVTLSLGQKEIEILPADLEDANDPNIDWFALGLKYSGGTDSWALVSSYEDQSAPELEIQYDGSYVYLSGHISVKPFGVGEPVIDAFFEVYDQAGVDQNPSTDLLLFSGSTNIYGGYGGWIDNDEPDGRDPYVVVSTRGVPPHAWPSDTGAEVRSDIDDSESVYTENTETRFNVSGSTPPLDLEISSSPEETAAFFTYTSFRTTWVR